MVTQQVDLVEKDKGRGSYNLIRISSPSWSALTAITTWLSPKFK